MKLLTYILYEKEIYISALEMASPGNRHSASCIAAHFRFLFQFRFSKVEISCM